MTSPCEEAKGRAVGWEEADTSAVTETDSTISLVLPNNIKKKEEKPQKPTGMGADFAQFVNDDVTSDVTLTIFDNDSQQRFSIKCHRLILSVRSPTLKTMLAEHKDEKEIFLDNIHRKCLMEQFIQFLYTDFIVASEDMIVDLIKIADAYKIVHLKVACGAFSKEKITEDNWLDFYNFAKKYNEKELQENCMEFIAENFESGLQEHKQYRDLTLDVLCDILERDDLQCDELGLFNLILDWGEYRKQTEDEIKKALKLLRLPIIGAKQLKLHIRNCPLIDRNDYMEAIEYCASPQLFESQKEEKRFHHRRAICRFFWMPQKGSSNYKLTNDNLTIEKTGISNWDLVALSSEPLEAGVQYFQVKIDHLNNDRSGMAIGVTSEQNIGSSSYSSCLSVSMEYGPYNLTSVTQAPQGNYPYKQGDVFGFKIDFVNDEIKVYYNGDLSYIGVQRPSQLRKVWAVVFMYYQNDQVSLCNDFPLKQLKE